METSTSLLERLRRAPDEASWRRFDGLYRPLVLRWLRTDASIRDDADDLAQEILSAVWQEIPSFVRERTGSFRKWLRTITVHRVQNHYRSRRSRPWDRTQAPSPLADLADDRSELAQRWDSEHHEHVTQQLLRMIEQEFNPDHCRAFQRQVFDGVTASDVADELGLAVNAVYLAKSRILARLREFGKDLLT